MPFRRGVLLAVASVLLAANLACHAEATVSMKDFRFDATRQNIVMAGDIKWLNNGEHRHTTKSNLEDLWVSDDVAPGSSFVRKFREAGSFDYHCTIHDGMRGTIEVPTAASPTEGTTSDSYTITWVMNDPDDAPSPPAIPSGYDMDVQILKPGAKRWRTFLEDQTGTQSSGPFSPDRKGVWKFRARMQKTDSGDATAYSLPARIEVSEP